MPATDTFSKTDTSSSAPTAPAATSSTTTTTASTTTTSVVEDEGAGAGSSGGAGAAAGNNSNSNTKKGFVYVQQPHYSVFDVPPAESLGKRRRRVHNYSMLARGPSLKGKELLLLTEGDEIDGESVSGTNSNSSRSTSPVSPAPPSLTAAAAASPSQSSTVTRMTSTNKTQNHSSSTKFNSSDGDKSSNTTSSNVVAPAGGFARRRRFLTSPIKTSDKTIIFSSNKVVSNSKKEEEESCSSKNNGSENTIVNRSSIFKKAESTGNSNNKQVSVVVASPAPTNCRDSSSISSNSVNVHNKLLASDVGEVKTSTKTSHSRNIAKLNSTAAGTATASSNSRTTTVNNVTATVTSNNSDLGKTKTDSTTAVTIPPPPPPSSLAEVTKVEEIPAKRLRRPTFKRFSEEEGYVDILSSRRNRREHARRSTPANNVKAPTPKSSYRSTSRSSLPAKAQHEPSPPPLIEAPLYEESLQSQSSAKDDLMSRLPKLKKSNNCAAVSIQLPVSSNSKAKLTPAVPPPSTSSRRKTNNHPVIYNALDDSEEEEELLDVDEYTDIRSELPKLSPKKGITVSPTKSPVKSFSAKNKNLPLKHRDVGSSFVEETVGSNSSHLLPNRVEGTPEESLTNNRELRRRKCTSSRRWTMPSKETNSLPSVILDRLPISQVQIRVKKCDTTLAPTSVAQKSPLVDINDQSPAHSRGSASSNLLEKTAESLIDDESSDWKQPKRKRWGENKHRWSKPRNKPGLLTGIRQGIKTTESLSMQLLKRSKFQRRYEKRGRPKVALLTGITKKKLKRIQDSVQRRKLTKKPIIAYTKFKDVRVDIINCICGRTDEFGLMVQCEVCLCWQHGMCFDILDGSMIPGFYVCQSCKSPKNVRPKSLIEGIRQKTYKKGILPRYPFAPQPSEKDQKLVHSTYELCKLIDSVEDIIRQNRIKEQIVLAEPENPKLYQWSTPRESPKDRVQKWYFNKYFLSVLRRLLQRNKKQPDYVEKLKNIVLFREKLKTYTQAFDEAKSAIARKIGSRGLILVEKLSEHQKKLDKINKLKAECAEEIVKQSIEEVKHEEPGQVSELLPPPPPKMEPESKTSDCATPSVTSSTTGLLPDKNKYAAWKLRLDKIIDCIDEIYREWDTSSDIDNDDEVTGRKRYSEFNKKMVQFNDVEPLPKNSPIIQDWKDVIESKNKSKSLTDNNISQTAASPSTGIKLKEPSPRKRPRHVKEEVLEPTLKKKSVASGHDYVKIRLVEDQKIKTKTQSLVAEDGSLSGTSTISGVDSQGGEDYWYNPIRDLNPEYEALKRFLLKDPLVDDDRFGDPTWRPRVEDISEDDWKSDMDSLLAFSEESESSSSEAEDTDSESTTDVEVEDSSMDASVVAGDVPQTESTTCESEPAKGDGPTNVTENSEEDWKKQLLSEKLNESTEDEEDPDWKMELTELEVNSSIKNKTSDVVTSHYPSSCSINGMKQRKLVGNPSGVLLVTSDTEAKVGDKVTVCINVSGGEETLGTGLIVGGNKGNNFIRLLHSADSNSETSDSNTTTDAPPTSVPLCRSCKESLGHKWTWNQLINAKGLEVICEDTLRSFIEELKLYQELGLSWSSLNVHVQLPTKSRNSAYFKQFSTPFSFQPTSTQSKCDDYRMKFSKENIPLGLNISSLLPDFTSQLLPTEPNQPASAEEESVLSLLSLSKTPVQFNGENVSELSIESLRKLTDRLQQNGPLTEDLAKAVGEPLVNGKIGLQNSHAFPSNPGTLGPATSAPPDICLRCSLRGKTKKTLTILSTLDSTLAKNMSEIEIVRLYNKIKEIITDTRAVLHVIKKAVLNRIWLTVEQVDAERLAVASGKTISPTVIQKKLALRRPEKHLLQQKSEYVDALLPYATYFISRFTKRDELNNAKRTWVEEMVKNYIRSKRVLKKMFDAGNEDERVAKEAKFYTALDNLRKSFDIVLTKKDIKLRRQNQVSQSSLESPTSVAPASSNGPTLDESITTEDSQNSKDLETSVLEAEVEKASKIIENGLVVEEDSSIKSKPVELDTGVQIAVPVSKESNGSTENPTETELEILARLTQYPIQMEDVNALLKITSEGKLDLDLKSDLPVDSNKIEECAKSLEDPVSAELKKMDTMENVTVTTTNANGIDVMEVDDIKLLEANLALKTTDNLEIGGDFDLINTIGTLGSSVDLKEQEDSDLLLNVFDDPVFSEPQEPTPCCSKSLVQPKDNHPPPVSTGPVLAKLTPEICKGYLLDDIKAHQLVIDTQLERVEAEIMELERRHGAGLREKDDSSLFEMLYANMQTMIHNYEVLSKIADRQVGENNPVEKYEEQPEQTSQYEAPSPTEDEAMIESSSESDTSEEELPDIPY